MIVLTIDAVPPSLNKVLCMHWAARRRLAVNWARKVWVSRAASHSTAIVAPRKAGVTIERHSPRKLDKDNLYGSYKIVVDQLVKQGLIIDDKPAHCELEITQHVGTPCTVIKVESRDV